MEKIEITGEKPLEGKTFISGSKNAALPILASCLLIDGKIELSNLPELSDIDSMLKLLHFLNVSTHKKGRKHYIESFLIKQREAPYDLVRKMRASFLVLGPLLAKYGEAKVSLPGGCAIGARPVNIHLDGLKKLGVEFVMKDGYIYGSAKKGLVGKKITLSFPSVGATENIIMAASLANGVTTIRNAAQEPEIVDLSKFLNKTGAKISGYGEKEIKIKGVKKLHSASYSIMPDRIEAGTFALAVLGCSGNVLLKNLNKDVILHLSSIFKRIKELNITASKDFKQLRVIANSTNKKPIRLKTKTYPGFPTDLQAQLTAAFTISNGESEITETIFENRFMHVQELLRMGAKIKQSGPIVKIFGQKKIFGAEVMATDLRASSSLIIAGMMAKGKTIVNRIYHLDRGYERLEQKLLACCAKIKRI